jgi:hypothetical protein
VIWTTREIAALLGHYSGQTFLGAVDAIDAIEFVFSEHPRRGNLLTLLDDGEVAHGYVCEPEAYVRAAARGGWRAA